MMPDNNTLPIWSPDRLWPCMFVIAFAGMCAQFARITLAIAHDLVTSPELNCPFIRRAPWNIGPRNASLTLWWKTCSL